MRKLVVALAFAWLPFASPAPAQQSVDLLPPKLDKGADPNDWEAFYDYGVRMLTRMPSQANAAFYWAERKDPTRAEPIFGQWAAFWMLDFSEWPDYLEGSPRVLQDPKVRAADSLRYRSWERNPFVNQALWMVITNKLPGNWNTYPYTQGWIEYTNQHYALAIDNFTVSLGSGDEYYWRRYDIALVYTQIGRYDSAAAHMELLLATMRKQDRKSLVYFYQSKAMYEYALGLLYMAQGKFGDAREAQARAIQEDLAFAPAHAALGRIAAIRATRRPRCPNTRRRWSSRPAMAPCAIGTAGRCCARCAPWKAPNSCAKRCAWSRTSPTATWRSAARTNRSPTPPRPSPPYQRFHQVGAEAVRGQHLRARNPVSPRSAARPSP